jgi:hypothetical protein
MENEAPFGPQIQLKKVDPPPLEMKEAELLPASPSALAKPSAPATASLAEVMESQFNVKLTETQRANLLGYTKSISETYLSQAPLICAGTGCPFLKNCPLAQNGITLPTDKMCPVEQVAIASWKQKFYESSGVHEDHPQKELIYSLIDELVSHSILQTRVFWQASQNGKVIKEECIGVNSEGDPIYTTRLDPSLDYLLRIGDKKVRVLRELLATPRAQVEAKRYTSADPSTSAANILKELSKLNGVKKIEGAFVQVNLDR